MEIESASERLVLSELKILSWPKKQTIFIADLHLGKVTHFRKSGIAIPLAIIKAEIDRIENVLLKFRPKRVFFLGDLFHSDLNHEWTIFEEFLQQYAKIEFTLIKGNHDILPETVYKVSQLKIEEEPFELTPFLLSHHPLEKEEIPEGRINLCGHIHPGITITGKGRSHLRLPCFYQSEQKMILPAFGRFTGLAKVKPSATGQAFVVLSQSVQKVKT